MKKFVFMLIALFVVLSVSVCAQDIITVDFTSSGLGDWVTSYNGMSSEFDSETGFYKVVSKTYDPNLSHTYKDDGFDTADYPVVRIRLKIVSGPLDAIWYGQFFFQTDNGANMGDEGTYVNFDLQKNYDWQDVEVDMRKINDSKWTGNIVKFRIDPVQLDKSTTETVTVLIEKLEFVPSDLVSQQDDLNGTTYETEKQTVIIPAGVLTNGLKKQDLALKSETVDETGKLDGYEPVIFCQTADGTENVVALSWSNGKRFVYVARQPGEYRAGYYTKEYVDTPDHWALNYIRFVSARKLFGGTSETEFSPDQTMTRGMFITVLGRMHGVDTSKYDGVTPYADVPTGEYYAPYIDWADEMKIASGLSSTNFGAEQPISRSDMAKILADYTKAYDYQLNPVASVSTFSDIGGLDSATADAIKQMQTAGIINGKGEGLFDPQGISTRAEVATVMARIIKSILGQEPVFDTPNQQAAESFIINFTDSDMLNQMTISGTAEPESDGSGLTMTGTNDQFFVRYYPESEIYIEEYPYVKMEYKIISTPSVRAQFYYYTDTTVTDTVQHPYVQFELAGNIGEWNTMTFDFSSLEKISAMEASSGSPWKGKLSYFGFYPLRMVSTQDPVTRSITIKYIGFFATEEDMNNFDASKLESNSAPLPEREPLTVSENLGKERIHIGVFSPYHENVTEQDVKEMAEAGVDIAFVSLGGINLLAQRSLLDWNAKYGIMAWMQDRSIRSGTTAYEDYTAKGKKLIEESYGSHPAFYGNVLSDEPGTVHYDTIAAYYKQYTEDFPGKVPFINLLPMYASNEQLTYGQSRMKIDFYDTPPADYEDYVRRYAEKVDTPYISTDIYPLRWDVNKKEKVTYKDYLKSIEAVARICRETGKEFWCYIQSFASRSRPTFRLPDETDLRWQAYSMLSFGIKNMFYYVWYGSAQSDYFNTPIDEYGNKTELWEGAKRLNNELVAISPVYLQYTNIGAFTHNATASKPYAQLLYPLESFEPIEEVVCDETLLIGCFEKTEGEGYAFTVVNMSEIKDNKTVSVSLKLKGNTVTSYFKGNPQVMTPDANGYYNFDLVCGDGVFITVE